MSQGIDARGDRPDPIESHIIDRQAAERGQDLDTGELPLAEGVFPQRHIGHPVQAFCDRPAVSDVQKQGLGSGTES